jgi:hypothetical protein
LILKKIALFLQCNRKKQELKKTTKKTTMGRISGITVQKTPNGIPNAITFSIKQYGELLYNFFLENNLEFPVKNKSIYSAKFRKEMDTSIEEYENGNVHNVDLSNFWDR